jgi:RNA polymerase-interacting CarD/CdnL/TRCF family regulator
MLTKARQILISEVTFAANVDEAEAGTMLDKVLAG